MTEIGPAPGSLCSGDLTLDLGEMRLTRRGAVVPLSSLPLRILALLLASPGQVVTRTRLKAALWPHADRIDIQRRLNTAIRALREALDERAGAPAMIETVRGLGYRWVGHEQAARRPSGRRPPVITAACLLILVLVTSLTSPARAPPLTIGQRDRFLKVVAMAKDRPASAMASLAVLIAQRPDYAPARLLRGELAVRAWREAPTMERLAAARAALAAARPVAGDSPDIDALDAELALNGSWDWSRAERYFRRALIRDPGHAGARRGLAWLLLDSGRPDEALSEVEVLLRHAVLTDDLRADLGWLTLRMGRQDLALALCNDGSAGSLNLLACRHTALARQGRVAEARDVALMLMRRLGAAPRVLARVRDPAPEVGYQRFLDWRTIAFVPVEGHWFQRAQVLAEAGRPGPALASLERAYQVHDPALVKLGVTPEFSALETTPRFRVLWAAVGPAPARDRPRRLGN